jgi:NAD(P)H-quinone oxidoreductase subunit 5
MEGPTPISALIHAATMVAAGVFLVARLDPLYTQFPVVQTVIAVVGTITCFLGASIALTQMDLKKGLAYSTVSQLGYMMLAMGCGAPVAGMFHLVTHAFFKAMLFLGSGSVIHAMEEVVGHEPVLAQDMRLMGGLRQKMPLPPSPFLSVASRSAESLPWQVSGAKMKSWAKPSMPSQCCGLSGSSPLA